MEQETLPGVGPDEAPAANHRPAFDALLHGLWQRVKDADGTINEAAWLRACAEHGFVGTCRVCGSYLVPMHPEQIGGRKDFEAHCSSWPAVNATVNGVRTVTGCGQVFNAPNGRRCERSMRWSEQPNRKAS